MPHVLLVEDDPSTAFALNRLLLKQRSYQVTHAATVAEALRRLDPPPDWVILDMNLPDGLGLAVLDAIRRAGLKTRVVVSSSTADAGLIAAVASYRPDAILPKPLDPALLPIAQEHEG
jgi:CheY-like chemotaxis protein